MPSALGQHGKFRPKPSPQRRLLTLQMNRKEPSRNDLTFVFPVYLDHKNTFTTMENMSVSTRDGSYAPHVVVSFMP